jgi:hypothetical protein
MSASEHDFKESLPYNSAKGCPAGYHKRASYKTEKGVTVPARCVKSTTHHKESSANFRKREAMKMTRRIRLHVPSIRSLSRKNCPPGMIPRRGYVRRFSSALKRRGYTVRRRGRTFRAFPKAGNVAVESRCVRDVGLPGKGARSGKGIGPLHKGELKKYGYDYTDSMAKRHAALKKAAAEYGALGVYRKLDAVAKLTMRTVPKVAEAFKEDRDWVKKELGPLKAF